MSGVVLSKSVMIPIVWQKRTRPLHITGGKID
jgi:hypothetical protein